METIITIPEAAKKIRRTPAALYDAIKRGDLAYEVKYGRVVVTVEEVMRYKRDTKSGPRNGSKRKKNSKKRNG